MCNKTIENYAHVLEFVPNQHKTQKMCNKVVGTFLSAKQFVLECYKTQGMCDKAVDTCPFVFDFVPNWCKTQEICDKVVSGYHFILKYCFDIRIKKCAIKLSTLNLSLTGLLQVRWLKALMIIYSLIKI